MAQPWGDDDKLLALNAKDAFTLRDACAAVHIFGATGSGKTSGSGRLLASTYLSAGMGGLVCCAKPEEVAQWRRYAAATGRSKSIIIFDETQGFNFLSYELARQGMEGIWSVIELLMRVFEIAKRASPSPGSTGDAFWQDSVRQILSYTIPVLYAAEGTVSTSSIVAFVVSAPTSPEQFANEEFRKGNFACQVLMRAASEPKIAIDRATLDATLRYWIDEYTAIPAKTRGNMVTSLSTTLGRFNHGRLNRCFCRETTIVPDMCFAGAVIVMAMPVLTWNDDGIIAQQLFKYLWQRVMESRNALPQRFRDRPVFLWADEAQYFINSYDSDFLSTCRSSRICVVFLSQNLPTYYAKMGQAEMQAADATVGKFNTHIFHQNACPVTNELATKLIGRKLQRRSNFSEGWGTSRNSGMSKGRNTNWGSSSNSGSSSGQGNSSSSSGSGSNQGSGENWGDNRGHGSSENSSQGYSETMDHIVEPSWFSYGLKSGGPRNGNLVTAIWFKNGGNFIENGGDNHLLTTFQQGRP